MRTELFKNEEVIIKTKKHWSMLLPPIILSIVYLVNKDKIANFYWHTNTFAFIRCNNPYGFDGVTFFILILIGAWLVLRIIARNRSICLVINLRVIYEHGVFSIVTKEIPLDKVNSISYHQPLFGRFFEYGHVRIQSGANLGAINARTIESSKYLKKHLAEYIVLDKRPEFFDIETNTKDVSYDPVEEPFDEDAGEIPTE